MRNSEKTEWDNQKVAELLRNVSYAYVIKGENKFKVAAYERAAVAVEHLTSDLKDLWEENKLKDIPGVGSSIAQHLNDLFVHGTSPHLSELLKELPPAMFEITKLPGLGPIKSFKLCQELGIWKKERAIERLKKAVLQHRIKNIPTFGEESEKNILEAIRISSAKKKEKSRMLLSFAQEMAEGVSEFMKKCPATAEIVGLGSLRRQNATIGDLDFAVRTASPQRVIAHFLTMKGIKKIINRGEKKASILLKNNTQIDLRTQNSKQWGSMLQYFTGSKEHNIRLREIALQQKKSLSEYGIYDLRQKKLIKTPTEKIFYRLLGMEWIPPEIREGKEEIELAQQKKLPKLVSLRDIKGDLHVHSSFDIEPGHDLGEDNIVSLSEAAANLGYEYLGLTEHNPSFSRHTPGQVVSLIIKKRKEIIRLKGQIFKKYGLALFNGLEIDIDPQGSLFVPEKALNFLDYAIVSIHGSFKLSKDKMTKRIISALSHPKVKILGHPTGRKIGFRECYEVDWEKIFRFCQVNNKILEINSSPDRLDLPDFLIKEALRHRVKLVINTDSHSCINLAWMRYGVANARRGWAEKKDIINALSTKEIREIMMLL